MSRSLLKSAALFLVLTIPAATAAQSEERPTRFNLTPKSGQARYTPVHVFLKCRGGREDPWGSCSAWRTVDHGDVRNLIGAYCVEATWDDGRVYRGSFLIEPGRGQARVSLRWRKNPPRGECA